MDSRWHSARVIDQVEAAYRSIVPPVADASMLAHRAEHFAAALRFATGNPDAGARLHRWTAPLAQIHTIDALLARVLDTALEMTKAQFGNVQLLDPATGSLLLTTESGFDAEFLEYFAIVDDVGSACGRAAKAGQTAVFDIAEDAGFAPHREVAAAAGFRAVQSTPLLDYTGRVVGMVSTHYRQPHRPSDAELRELRWYADAAGDAVARTLGGDTDSDPIGRAMAAVLLNPAVTGSARASGDSEDGVPRPLTGFDPERDLSGAAALFAMAGDRLVRHLLDVGLRLRVCEATLDRYAATPQDMRAVSEAVTGILEDLDLITRDAALAMLALAREHASRSETFHRNVIRRST